MRYRSFFRVWYFFGCVGLVMLFIVTACYVFAALGLLALGVVAFPSVMLGRLGILTVTSDIQSGALLLISAGVLLLGAGMSFGAIPVCRSAYGVLSRFVKRAAVRRERAYNEEDTTS